MSNDVVIIGAGHAGGMTAISLRQQDYQGLITLIGEEAYCSRYESDNNSGNNDSCPSSLVPPAHRGGICGLVCWPFIGPFSSG